MTDRVLVAQISDLHVKRPGELAYDRVDTAAALVRCIDALNRLAPRPDLLVISGDLVDRPSPEAYRHLRELLAPLQIPFVAVPGNHDDRALMRESFAGTRATAPLNHATAIGAVDVLTIDSTVPEKDFGTLDADTLAWLEAALAASTSRPALLFMHHPPFTTGIAHMDRQNLRNADALAGIVQRHPRARLIAAGHVHRATLTTFAGIAATICPAPNHAVALDLDARLPPTFTIEPPAFHLHVWFPGPGFGAVVTHWLPVGQFEGPYPFHDNDGLLL